MNLQIWKHRIATKLILCFAGSLTLLFNCRDNRQKDIVTDGLDFLKAVLGAG